MRPDHPAVGVLALGLARRLGLPDTALLPGDAPAAGAEPRRIEVVRPDGAEAEVLALPWAAGWAWLLAPGRRWAVRAAAVWVRMTMPARTGVPQARPTTPLTSTAQVSQV